MASYVCIICSAYGATMLGQPFVVKFLLLTQIVGWFSPHPLVSTHSEIRANCSPTYCFRLSFSVLVTFKHNNLNCLLWENNVVLTYLYFSILTTTSIFHLQVLGDEMAFHLTIKQGQRWTCFCLCAVRFIPAFSLYFQITWISLALEYFSNSLV